MVVHTQGDRRQGSHSRERRNMRFGLSNLACMTGRREEEECWFRGQNWRNGDV